MPTNRTDILRGEIYWLDWNPARGSEQAGRRPALVLGSDSGNRNERYPLTIVAAISTVQRNIRTHVILTPSEENGLLESSSVKCEQLLTVSKERILNRIGRINSDDMLKVEAATKLALTLP